MQLPDYHDVIEHPMDFATVRKKLANGAYPMLEQLEVYKAVNEYIFYFFLKLVVLRWIWMLILFFYGDNWN